MDWVEVVVKWLYVIPINLPTCKIECSSVRKRAALRYASVINEEHQAFFPTGPLMTVTPWRTVNWTSTGVTLTHLFSQIRSSTVILLISQSAGNPFLVTRNTINSEPSPLIMIMPVNASFGFWILWTIGSWTLKNLRVEECKSCGEK